MDRRGHRLESIAQLGYVSSAVAGVADKIERFGPFIMLKPLGAGGMGTVHLAAHPGTSGLLVVKRMHPGMVREPTLFKRFVHEAEVASHVQHPNVAALLAMGTVDGEPFLATEYVFGIQASQIVERVHNAAVDPLPLAVALKIGADLAAGVSAIHEARHRDTGAPLGLVHRDVGARNVLVGFDGRVRLIDLGLGKSILADWQTSAEVLAGSPDYMPPEQAMGAVVDGRADVYAAAVVTWELLTGRKRIREDTVSDRVRRAIGAQPESLLDRRPDASARLESLLRAAMAPDPERRLSTAAELSAGLEVELRKVRPWFAGDDLVREWLDSACATIIAKERRALQTLKDAMPEGTDEASHVEMIVGGVQGWVPPQVERRWARRLGEHFAIAGLVAVADPSRWSSASAAQLVSGVVVFTTVLCTAAAITVWLLLPPELPAPTPLLPPAAQLAPDLAPAVSSGPPATSEPAVLEPIPGVELVPVDPPPAPRSAPAAGSILRADKEALLVRLRQLRKVKYEVAWQRRLTALSAKISRARSRRALDQVDGALTRMENAR